MKINKQNLSSLLLRLGLAIVLLYAAISSMAYPAEWVGYLPSFLAKMHSAEILLRVFAIYETVLVLWLLSGRLIKYVAWLTSLTLLGIILARPGDFILTFRDVGLLFSALALSFGKE